MESKIILNEIDNGTAIDHIPAGKALQIIKILGINSDASIGVAMNVPSTLMRKKDLIFIGNHELSEEEINKIGLIGKGSTVNIIRNKKVIKKESINLPKKVFDLIKCINPNCISNHDKIPTKFFINALPLQAHCFYCEKTMSEQQIVTGLK